MILGRVIGTVWATRKDPKLEGLKLLIVQKIDLEFNARGDAIVAVDACEAGVGEVVLLSQGSSARQTAATDKRPVDAVVMAIVDNLEVLDEAVLDQEYAERREAVSNRLASQLDLN